VSILNQRWTLASSPPPRMFRSNYPAIQELFHSPHPSIPFFVASFIGLLFILLPAMFRRTNKFPVKGRVIPLPLNRG
jgi:hypothetical protein